jgi:outer membrane protein
MLNIERVSPRPFRRAENGPVRRRILAALGIALFPWAPAGAETLELSLRDAVARALSDGTAARIATERVDVSRAQADQARSALLPQISGQVQDYNQVLNLKTFGLTLPGFPSLVGPFNVFDAHVTLAAQLIDFAARRRYQAARQGVVVADVERERTENEVATAVATLYVALQRAQANVDATRANLELFTKLRDLANDQREAGVATKLDSTRADVALAREQQTLLVSENQRDAGRLSLLHAIGADQTLDVVLVDALREEPGTETPEEALSAAHSRRPELRSIEERLRSIDLSIAARRAEKLPTLAAQFQGGYNGNHLGDLSWNRTVGALVSVPIYTGGRITAEIAESESQRRELVLERTETERQVEEDVRRALLALQSATNRAHVAAESVRLASEELDFARDRFANGVSSSIEVDNAQSSYASARGDRIAALADEAQARFDLARATGQIRDWIGSTATEVRQEK